MLVVSLVVLSGSLQFYLVKVGCVLCLECVMQHGAQFAHARPVGH
jgi:hypothetical protein